MVVNQYVMMTTFMYKLINFTYNVKLLYNEVYIKYYT